MRTLLLLLGLVFYPLMVHALVVLEVPGIAVFGLVLASLTYLVVLGTQGRGVTPVWLWMYGLLALVGGISLYARSVHVLFLPPALINLGMLAVFGGTLRVGKVPLVERLLRIAYSQRLPFGELPPGLAQSARRMTWAWVIFFACMTLLSLGLARWASLEVWSLFVNVLYYLFVAALLIFQHGYRHFRFRQHGPVSLRRLAYDLARISPRDPTHPFFGRGGRP